MIFAIAPQRLSHHPHPDPLLRRRRLRHPARALQAVPERVRRAGDGGARGRRVRRQRVDLGQRDRTTTRCSVILVAARARGRRCWSACGSCGRRSRTGRCGSALLVVVAALAACACASRSPASSSATTARAKCPTMLFGLGAIGLARTSRAASSTTSSTGNDCGSSRKPRSATRRDGSPPSWRARRSDGVSAVEASSQGRRHTEALLPRPPPGRDRALRRCGRARRREPRACPRLDRRARGSQRRRARPRCSACSRVCCARRRAGCA